MTYGASGVRVDESHPLLETLEKAFAGEALCPTVAFLLGVRRA